ncbi:DUF3043 domain-containing protein [Streptosporangium sp. NPDC000396]|uniref:DUF3043 domain-containing protein n=1 Tax=Streptosporangium sp. NPDC000396 TaxID=3366185 RepID=UPI0036ADFE10
MFRRTQTTADDSPVSANDPKPAGKGRPTPKRRDAEGQRRRPVNAPQNRKEAYKQLRERQANDRAKAREGMLRGDERYFPARDQGAARKFARDWVDSRRLVGQYFLPFSLLILLFTWIPFPVEIRYYVNVAVITIGWPLMMVGVVLSSAWVAWKVKKLVVEKFPDEKNLKGVGLYAAMRALQIRKLRFPPPTVLPGGKPVPAKK